MIPNIGAIYKRKWNNQLNRYRQSWDVAMVAGIDQLIKKEEGDCEKPKKIIV